MIIHHNLMASNANRQFKITGKKKEKSTEKLSSGYRINRSADDAAGLAISEKMRRQIRGLSQAANNIQDGIGYVQTGEGALNEVHDMLQRMNELAVKASNETNSDDDIAYIDAEVQQLKSEIGRVFETTSFNEKLIWVPNMDELVQTGTERQSTISFKNTAIGIDATNANANVLPLDGIKLHADETGVYASWKGYDGNTYQTGKASWNDIENNGNSFHLKDYFPDTLKDGSGNPLFDYTVSFKTNKYATQEDVINAINTSSCSSGSSARYSLRFEDAAGNAKSYPGISVSVDSTSYNASYVSYAKGDHTFDAADDSFIEASPAQNLTSYPHSTTVEAARADNSKWTFSFDVDGIGTVTATTTGGRYYANSDLADDDEHVWWEWQGRTIDGRYEPHYMKGRAARSIDGSLSSVMNALTGSKYDSTPGLLKDENGGAADTGGTIELNFNASKNYSSGGASDSNIFSFTMSIAVAEYRYGRNSTQSNQ